MPEQGNEEDEDGAQSQQKHELVAIKRVPLLRSGMEKLMDLWRELELMHALRHANVLRMERLYVDGAEECLWIGMELMDRSLVDVLAVVGEDAGPDLEAEEGDSDSVGSKLVEIPEKMVARFVWDVSGNIHYFSQIILETARHPMKSKDLSKGQGHMYESLSVVSGSEGVMS